MAKRSATHKCTQDTSEEDSEQEEALELRKVIKKTKKQNVESDLAIRSANSFSRFDGHSVELMPSITVTIRFPSHTNSSVRLTNDTDLSRKPSSIEEGCSKDGNTISSSSRTSKLLLDSKHYVGENKQLPQNVQYYKLLKTLNESFLEWINDCLEKSPYCNFMPAFGDYEKYIIKIEEKYFVQNLQTETPSVQENILSDLQFPSKYTVDERGIKHTFNSGSKATKKESTKKENSVNFKSFPPALSTTSMSTSSFGFQPTSSSSTSSVSGKSFFRLENGEVSSTLVTNVLTTTTTTTPYLAGFSFKTCDNSSTSDRVSKPPPACFATEKCPVHELKEAAQNTDRIADHHRIKYSQVEKNNALFSKRCKLFCKKGNCYMDKGIGILYIKMVQRKSQLLIKADSNIGDILLNIRLNSTVQLKRVGKNNVLIVYNPNPSLDLKSSTTEPVTFLIHVNTSEEADELLLKLNHFMS